MTCFLFSSVGPLTHIVNSVSRGAKKVASFSDPATSSQLVALSAFLSSVQGIVSDYNAIFGIVIGSIASFLALLVIASQGVAAALKILHQVEAFEVPIPKISTVDLPAMAAEVGEAARLAKGTPSFDRLSNELEPTNRPSLWSNDTETTLSG